MRRIFSMLALCSAFGMVSAQTLKVAEVIEVKPGETAIVELDVNTNGVEYGAFQANLIFPKTGFTLGKATTNSDWESSSITVGTLKEGKANIGGLSTNDSPMPDGIVGKFEVKADNDAAYGDYTATISNFEFINGTADKKIDDVTFTIKVVSAYSVTLDEDATVAPEAAEGVNVTVKRFIPANTWSTICLPFAMSSEQLTTALGSVKLGDFTGCVAQTDNEENVTNLAVHFTEVSSIEANHPYIIKVESASDIASFTVQGVDITPLEELSVDKDPYTVGKGKTAVTYYNSFVGTYVAGTAMPENTLFLNGGSFWYSKGNNTVKAYRGYFDFYDVLSSVEGESRAYITFDDITAIKGLKTNGGEEIYTLSGQRVEKAGKGVYIVNGKKVIKK